MTFGDFGVSGFYIGDFGVSFGDFGDFGVSFVATGAGRYWWVTPVLLIFPW